MVTAYLLLGTNIECRIDHLKNAIQRINREAGTIAARSAVYETAAWGKVEQPDYLNQALKLETLLSPSQLLHTTAEIENKMGRVRKKIWGPRIIDIDILFYGDFLSSDKKLILPHPHIQDRRFVLTPLSEIAPDLIHPVAHQSIEVLLQHCTDPLWVAKYETSMLPG